MTVLYASLRDGTALPVARLRSWILRGGAAVCEQALFAGGNFVLNVALARSLPPAEYGAFAFTTTILLILTGVYNAFILEPATVLEPSRYESHLGRYWRAQVRLHVGFTIGLGSLLVAAGLIAAGTTVTSGQAEDAVGGTLIVAGLSAPAIYLFWLARRFLYVLARPLAALAGSAVYFCGIGLGIAVGLWLHLLTPFVGFAILGAASMAAAMFMLGRVARLTPATEPGATHGRAPFTLRTLVRERWQYGRWLLGTVCLEMAVAPAVTFIATATLGLAAVGTLRAMQTFVAPLGHGMSALSSLALPALARDFGHDRLAAFQRKSRLIVAMLLASGLCVELVLIFFHQPLEQVLYGGKYAAAAILIPVFGLAALFEAIAATYTMVLSAARRPRLLLIGSAISAPLGLAIGVVCIHLWGIFGAALSFALNPAISTLVRRRLARPWLSASAAAPAPAAATPTADAHDDRPLEGEVFRASS